MYLFPLENSKILRPVNQLCIVISTMSFCCKVYRVFKGFSLLTKHDEFYGCKRRGLKALLSFASLHKGGGLLDGEDLSSLAKQHDVLLHICMEYRK